MDHCDRGIVSIDNTDNEANCFGSKSRGVLLLHCFTLGFKLHVRAVFLALFFALTLVGCGHRPRLPLILAGEKHLVIARGNEPLSVIETRSGALVRQIARTGEGNSSQVIYDRVLYQGSSDSRITGRDIAQQSKPFDLWQCPDDTVSSESSCKQIKVISVDEFRVYAQGSDGKLWAIDKSTGQTRWSTTTDSRGIDHIRIAGDAAYLSTKRVLHKVDARTGIKQWEFSFNDAIGPAYATDAKVFVTTVRGAVRGLDENNGDVVWKYEANGKACDPKNPRVFVDEKIAVGCFDGKTHGISLARRARVWLSKGEVLGLVDGIAVIQSDDDTIVGLDVGTGTTKWKHRVATEILPHGIVRDHHMYVSDRKSNVYGIETTTGKQMLRYRWPTE